MLKLFLPVACAMCSLSSAIAQLPCSGTPNAVLQQPLLPILADTFFLDAASANPNTSELDYEWFIAPDTGMGYTINPFWTTGVIEITGPANTWAWVKVTCEN